MTEPIPECVPALIEQLRAALADMERFADDVERTNADFKAARRKLPDFDNAKDAAKKLRIAKKRWEQTNDKVDAQARCEAEEAARAFRAELKKESEKLSQFADYEQAKGDYAAAKAAATATARSIAACGDAGRGETACQAARRNGLI